MTAAAVPPEVWADEGRRLAPTLHDVAAAVISGRDPDTSAHVALGIARAVARERKVAVADLVGGIAALRRLDDEAGLLEALRDGLPLSDIGFPLPGAPDVYVLPSGHGAIAERWVFESARWERLVAGFRDVDALLLVVARPSAPGLATLVGRMDGVIAVDLPPTEIREWPLLGVVDHPEPDLPPILAAAPARPSDAPRRRRAPALLVGAMVLLGAVAAATWWRAERSVQAEQVEQAGQADPSRVVPEPVGPDSDVPQPRSAPARLDLRLGPLVNPSDSAAATRFAVELIAANTLPGANSRLVVPGERWPAPTVAPVTFGASGTPWYRAVVGAWPMAAGAESWLAAQRTRGVVPATQGRVVEVPFALLLEDGVAQRDVQRRLDAWARLAIHAYALRQDDGRARLYAGAFESVGQAARLASTLRELGHEPRLAYRTGRAF